MTDFAQAMTALYFGVPASDLDGIDIQMTAKFDDGLYRATDAGWELIERRTPPPRHTDYRRLFGPDPPSS